MVPIVIRRFTTAAKTVSVCTEGTVLKGLNIVKGQSVFNRHAGSRRNGRQRVPRLAVEIKSTQTQ